MVVVVMMVMGDDLEGGKVKSTTSGMREEGRCHGEVRRAGWLVGSMAGRADGVGRHGETCLGGMQFTVMSTRAMSGVWVVED